MDLSNVLAVPESSKLEYGSSLISEIIEIMQIHTRVSWIRELC